jgi:hypothetical protein
MTCRTGHVRHRKGDAPSVLSPLNAHGFETLLA